MTNWEKYYQTRYSYEPKRGIVWREICRWLQQYIAVGGTVLDLGAGYCDFINNIKASHRIALDISSTMSSTVGQNVEFRIGSCTDLSFLQPCTVDVVFASNLFEHLSLSSLHETLEQIFLVLKNNGKLIILQPNFRYCFKEYFDDYTHLMVYTDRSMVDLLTTHSFIIERSLPRFIPFSMKSCLPAIAPLVWLYLRSPLKPWAGQMLIVAQKKENQNVEWQDHKYRVSSLQ